MPSAHPTRAALSDNFLSILSVSPLCFQSLDESKKYVGISKTAIKQILCSVKEKALIRNLSALQNLTWTRNYDYSVALNFSISGRKEIRAAFYTLSTTNS